MNKKFVYQVGNNKKVKNNVVPLQQASANRNWTMWEKVDRWCGVHRDLYSSPV